MKIQSTLRFVLGGSLAALLALHSVQAVDLTYNGATTGNWNTSETNFTGLWANGNTAVFGGAASSTVTINEAAISAVGVTFNVNNDIIAQSGGNNLSLTSTGLITVGSGLTATINAPLAGTAGMVVEGGGTLNLGAASTLDGGGSSALGLVVGSTSANNTVNLSSGGAFSVANGTNRRSLTIGGSTFGGNSVAISTPGTLATPTFWMSGNDAKLNMGVSSSSNSLTFSNGAYLYQTASGGTTTWTLGTNAGANSNALEVTGAGSTIDFSSNQAIVVGSAGSSNTVEVSAGGVIETRRWQIGANGGDSNSVLVTGSGSSITTSFTASASTNALFEIGTTVGSDGNYLSVAAGGAFNFYGSSTARNFSIGRAGDNNYYEVKGTNSAANITHVVPITVGGIATGAGPGTVGDGGTGNHLDINTGGAMTLTGAPIYVLGTDSEVNLGNGTGTATLTVGAATGYTAGVFLKNASGRLNFDGGKLIAGADGNLVSGAGKVDLLGDASVSTTFSGSVISTEITGSGDFTKEGAGTLDLTSASNSYTGDTIVSAGTLSITNAYLANAAAVRLFGKLDLSFVGTDTVGALYLNGVPQAGGTWGATGSGATNINDTYFSGAGMLFVNAIPEPASVLLGGLGLLTLLRRRRGA